MGITVDVDHLREHGYVLVENVVTADEAGAVVDLLCDYLDVNPHASIPGFRRKAGEVAQGIVPLHQHQSLWDTRQSPNMHEAFSQVYDNHRLWVTVDRASYKPRLSERAGASKGDPNAIHIDRPVLDTSSFAVQGVLYLTDTAEDQGAWECVPGLYQRIKRGDVTSFDRRTDSVEGYEIKRVAGPAGSIVIWDGLMPHSSGHNWTNTPRFAQYITMHPEGDEATRQERVSNWQDRRAPPYWRSMPNQEDPEPWATPAQLTELGEQLLGARPWGDTA